MKVAHLTTVDLSLRYLVLAQLLGVRDLGGEAIGISAPGPDVPALEAAGVRHIALSSSTRGMSLFADLKSALQLWRILRSEKVDILHTHNPKPGVYGRIVGRLAGVPIVVNTIHGLYATEDDPLLKRVVVYGLEAIAARFSDHELAQNPEDIDLLRRLWLYPDRKLSLLGNGVDLIRFDPDRARFARDKVRAELGAGPDDVVVGMVGRLVEEKGYRQLFEAAGIISEPRYRFVVVGPDDPTKPDALDRELIEQATANGVRFLGMRTDVDELYGGFDLFALPSYREGFPRAAMEAASTGLPIVATNIRGCRQVVEDGVTGLLVPVGDGRALADALRRLGEDAPARAAMGERAYLRARTHFDERLIVSTVLDVYRRLANRKGLTWPTGVGREVVRLARVEDRKAIAELHMHGINTGFLSSLGPRFLAVLYLAMIRDPDSVVLVADRDGVVVGFVAGTTDTGAFYRRFARRYAPAAGLAVLARLRPGMLARMRETRGYGSNRTGEVKAELLSMAVAPAARGRGLANRLGGELLAWAGSRHLDSMRVVVGAANEPAIRVYRKMGFGEDQAIEVHSGEASVELTWRS
jgi:glycosyltransferase involved in cell wall biosynthesis/ribosomal protein S18 acetylase RimI-like enzyme